jgi:hypothetical protein
MPSQSHDDVLPLISNDLASRKKPVSPNFNGRIAVTLHLNRFQSRVRQAEASWSNWIHSLAAVYVSPSPIGSDPVSR